MTDMNLIASAIRDAAPADKVRIRQGVIQSVNADGTANVRIAGSTITTNNIKVASHTCPVPNASCLLATDGRDWFLTATLAPTGPAWGAMRQNAAQTIADITPTAIDWTTRTDTASNGLTIGNTGLTCVVPGLYQISGGITFATNTTGLRFARLLLNGNVAQEGTSTSGAAGTFTRVRADGLLRLAIGDVVNIQVYQSSGVGLATQIAAGSNMLRAVWIGPSV